METMLNVVWVMAACLEGNHLAAIGYPKPTLENLPEDPTARRIAERGFEFAMARYNQSDRFMRIASFCLWSFFAWGLISALWSITKWWALS